MERLKAWLLEQGIEIVRPGIGNDGIVTLLLRPPSGPEFEVGFYPDDLEADPETAIHFVETIMRET